MVRIKISNIWYSAYRFFDTPVISRTVDIANISYDFTTSNTGPIIVVSFGLRGILVRRFHEC